VQLTLANGLNSNIPLPPSSNVEIVGPTAAFYISGFAGGTDGAILNLVYNGTQALYLYHLSQSAVGNQITTLIGAGEQLTAGPFAMTLRYSATTNTWVQEARSWGLMPPGGSTGQLLSKTNVNNYATQWVTFSPTSGPKGQMGYAFATTNSSPVGTTAVQIGSNLNINIVQNRYYRISAGWQGFTGTVAGDLFVLSLNQAGTALWSQNVAVSITSGAAQGGTLVSPRWTGPSTSLIQFTMTAVRASGTGTATFQGTATSPLWIMVEDVGP
jgi:hypothetical protein